MSNGAVIKEGSVGRKFRPVDKLQINNQGGTNSLWRRVVEMDSKTITENGFYLAKKDSLYAYDEVVVNVTMLSEAEKKMGKTITGIDPTTGNPVSVGVDDDGNLTEEMLPDHIHIVIAPKKTTYSAGDTIDFSGIHVYLVNADNTQFTNSDYPTGEIPFNELIFPVTTAESSGGGGGIDFPDEQSSGSYTITSICSAEDMVSWGLSLSPFGYEMDTYAATQLRAWIDQNQNYAVFAEYDKIRMGSGYGAFHFWAQNLSVGSTITLGTSRSCVSYIRAHFTNSSGAYNIDSWYVGSGTNERLFVGERDSISDPDGRRDASPLGATAHQGGDTQEVPVQWTRSDGETLEDKFQITISSGGGS